MLEEIHEGRNKLAHKVYVFALMIIILIIVPIQEFRKLFDYYHLYNNFIATLSHGPSSQKNELDIS